MQVGFENGLPAKGKAADARQQRRAAMAVDLLQHN